MNGPGHPPPGHNGGPPLNQDTQAGGRCRDRRHWRAPPEAESRAYEFFWLGLSRRRVRQPAGACDRVVLSAGRPPAFSATTAEFGCINFDARPPDPRPRAGGFVTIYEAGRVVWQEPEEAMPARFAQEQLDLSGPLIRNAGSPAPRLS